MTMNLYRISQNWLATIKKGNKMSFKEYVIILFASLAMAHSGYASTPVKKGNLEIRKIENTHKSDKVTKTKKPKPKVKRPGELKKVTKK